MFYILSRIFAAVAEPLTYIILAFCLAIFLPSQFKKIRIASVVAAFILLFIFTNPMLYSYAQNSWQPRQSEYTDTTHYDYGIVLGGFGHYDNHSSQVDYQRAIDRLFEAVRYYREGRIDRIIITGDGLTTDSATFYREMQQLFNIPAHDLIREPNARSTRENAQYSAQIIADEHHATIAVFTSAIHLPRARLSFEQEGINATFIPCDYQYRHHNPTIMFIPNPKILVDWADHIHEWIGYISYKITRR